MYVPCKYHRPSNKKPSMRQGKTPFKLHICKTIIMEERVMNLRGGGELRDDWSVEKEERK